MKEQNKYILIGIFIFPFIIGMAIGDFIESLGRKIFTLSEKASDKYGGIIVELSELEIKKLKALRDICREDDLLDLQAYDSISKGAKISNAWEALKVIDKITDTDETSAPIFKNLIN